MKLGLTRAHFGADLIQNRMANSHPPDKSRRYCERQVWGRKSRSDAKLSDREGINCDGLGNALESPTTNLSRKFVVLEVRHADCMA
jgi:hypothetical protein